MFNVSIFAKPQSPLIPKFGKPSRLKHPPPPCQMTIATFVMTVFANNIWHPMQEYEALPYYAINQAGAGSIELLHLSS